VLVLNYRNDLVLSRIVIGVTRLIKNKNRKMKRTREEKQLLFKKNVLPASILTPEEELLTFL